MFPPEMDPRRQLILPYVISLSAYRETEGKRFLVVETITFVGKYPDAEFIANKRLYCEYPTSEGWICHASSMMEINLKTVNCV